MNENFNIKEFIEKDELKEVLEEQERIIKELIILKMKKNCKSNWLYWMLNQRYFSLQKKKYKLYKIIQDLSFKVLLEFF